MKYRALRHSLCASAALTFVAATAAAQSSTKARGAEAESEELTLEVASNVRLELESASPPLELSQPTDARAASAPRQLDTDTEKKPVRDDAAAEQTSNGRRTVGLVIGAVGIAALGTGGYFGLRAFSKWSDRNDNCAGGCNAAAKSAGDDAKSAATMANIGIGLGLVAVAVGGYLVITAQASGQPSGASALSVCQAHALQFLPTLSPTGGGLLLRGSY